MVPSANQWKQTFRERFCEHYKCAPERFEEEVFWRCIHWHAGMLARILYSRDPSLFKEDFEFIHELGGIRDPLIFKSELNRFHGRNVRDKGWIRGTFHIRVSAKRVINLKKRIYRAVRPD